MSSASTMDELVARLELSQGAPSLLLLVAGEEADVSNSSLLRCRELLVGLLRSYALEVHALGTKPDAGPLLWVKAMQEVEASIYLTVLAPEGKLLEGAVARELNAQRQHLQSLRGPLLLLVPARMERRLQQEAPDFHTWRAATFILPSLGELEALSRARGALQAPVSRPISPRQPIRFLHLSDLHLRPGNAHAYDQDRVLNGLLAYLKQERGKAPLDLIFLTGDVGHSGQPGEYARAVEFLERLLEVTGVPPERLFVVPGNHDVDRAQGRWLLRTLGSDEEATAFFVEPSNRRRHEQKFSAYREALAKWLGPARGHGLRCGEEAVEIVNIRGDRIAVASFNSAWFAQDDEDLSNLWLGEACVDLASRRIQKERPALAVALMHHPTEHLSEQERSNVENHLERTFDLVLRGHLHKDKIRGIQSARGGYLEIAAPAAYQGSQWPNGCVLGDIDVGGREVILTPLKFGNGADPWVLDTTVFPNDAESGYRRAFELRSRQAPEALGLVESLRPELEQLYAQLGSRRRQQIQRELGEPSVSNREQLPAELKSPTGLLDLWQTLSRESRGFGGLPLSPILAKRLSEHVPEPARRIALNGREDFDKLLQGFADFWREHGATWLKVLTPSIGSYEMIVGAYLSRVSAGEVRFGDMRFPRDADILLGMDGDPPSRRALIEVKKWNHMTGGMISHHAEALKRLNEERDAGHLAIILFCNKQPSRAEVGHLMAEEPPVHVLCLEPLDEPQVLWGASSAGATRLFQSLLARLEQLKGQLHRAADKRLKGLRVTSAVLKPDMSLSGKGQPVFDVRVDGECRPDWRMRLFAVDAMHPNGVLLRESEESGYVRQGSEWTFDTWRLQGGEEAVLVIAFAAPVLPETESLEQMLQEASTIPQLQVAEVLLSPPGGQKP